jgi:hypothetical protein
MRRSQVLTSLLLCPRSQRGLLKHVENDSRRTSSCADYRNQLMIRPTVAAKTGPIRLLEQARTSYWVVEERCVVLAVPFVGLMLSREGSLRVSSWTEKRELMKRSWKPGDLPAEPQRRGDAAPAGSIGSTPSRCSPNSRITGSGSSSNCTIASSDFARTAVRQRSAPAVMARTATMAM